MKCSNCGYEVDDKMKFCPECGNELKTIQDDQMKASEKEEKEREEDEANHRPDLHKDTNDKDDNVKTPTASIQKADYQFSEVVKKHKVVILIAICLLAAFFFFRSGNMSFSSKVDQEMGGKIIVGEDIPAGVYTFELIPNDPDSSCAYYLYDSVDNFEDKDALGGEYLSSGEESIKNEDVNLKDGQVIYVERGKIHFTGTATGKIKELTDEEKKQREKEIAQKEEEKKKSTLIDDGRELSSNYYVVGTDIDPGTYDFGVKEGESNYSITVYDNMDYFRMSYDYEGDETLDQTDDYYKHYEDYFGKEISKGVLLREGNVLFVEYPGVQYKKN